MDSFCSFFVHVRLRSFRSMTSFFCPMSGSGHSDLWSVRISVRLFCVPFKGKKIRWPSLSFFRSCPVFRIYDLTPPPWTVYSDHSCPVSHHLVLFPFEFRFVCFVSRSKVKKFDDQACPFFVHVRLRSFRSMHPPPHPSRRYHFICICEGGGGRGQGGPWPMGDSGSCSGVLKYAVTWYCISTFTSLHRGLDSGGVGGGGGRVGKLV